MPASTVISLYDGNEVAGDNALKNKILKVKGIVDHVGKDILNKPFVILKPTADYVGMRDIQCVFATAHESELATVRPGQELIIYGECKGLMMNVIIEDCEIMEK